MMFPIDYNGDVLNHNARVGVDGGIVESTDFLADFSEQTKRVNMPLLLDIYPNAAAAYSLRKLRTAYTGSAIRVRRSSDNTETDIGFNNAGDLDTSALMAFVGNGNGFVSTWYDQSGNNRNATQTTQADQPQIVRNGLILTVNSKPCIYPLAVAGMNMGFNDSNLGTVNKHIFVVADTTRGENNTINYQSVLIASYSGSGSIGNDFSFSYYHGEPTIRLRNYDGSSFVLNSGTTSGYKIWQTIRTSSLLYIADNNNPYTVGGTPNTVYNSNTYRIGGHVSAGANNSPKLVQEVIYYPTNQSPNRIGIETNINSYYKIYQQEALLLDYYPDAAAAYSLRKLRSGYTGAAIQVRRSSDNAVQNIGFDSNGGLDTTALTTFVGTGNTGFVTTWYDQSGNNRNATQTGTTAQPVIFSGGTVINDNNKSTLNFNGSQQLEINYFNYYGSGLSQFFTITVSKRTGALGSTQIVFIHNNEGGTPANRSFNSGYYTSTGLFASHHSTDNLNNDIQLRAAYNLNQLYLLSTVFDTNNVTRSLRSQVYVNSLLSPYSSSGGGADLQGNISIANNIKLTISGTWGGLGRLVGNIQEVIFYSTNQSTNRPLIEANINSYYNIYVSENDAQSFIDAAAITNSTQRQAINKLVYDLKAYGLWYKMKAIYPFVGGTAASHKFNLKDPRDVDGAFRLVFNGGWTHSATGALPNGTTGWANTFLNPNTSLILNSAHISSYIRNTTTGMLMGTTVGAARLFISPNIGGTSLNFDINSNAGIVQTGNTNIGLWLGSRTLSNSMKLYNNINIIFSSNAISTSLDNNNIYLSARNVAGSASNFSSAEMGFSTIGDGLTDTEAANLYTAVQTFQTTLGRQV